MQEISLPAATESMAAMLTSESLEGNAPLTVSLSGDFRGRIQLVKVARQAVVGLLVEAGCDREAQNAGMIVAHELTENLVKYSRTAHTSFAASVHRSGPRSAAVLLETQNDASPEELVRVQSLLSEVESRADKDKLYQERIASSSTRSRSELGLLRIVAEAAMQLELSVLGTRLTLHARSDTFSIHPNASAAPRAAISRRKGESIR